MEHVTSIPHVILRSVAVYFFMIVALRIFGKKELSQLNPADVILILLISNSVQNAMVGTNTDLNGGLAAAAILFALNYLLKILNFKFKFFNILVEDKAEILVHKGIPNYKMLSKLDITHDELMEAVREHGIEHLSDVALAILEIDGNISVISGDHSLKQTHFKRRKNRKNIVTM